MNEAKQHERRIAACLNACQSVSTEDLERYYMTGAGIDEALEEAGLQDHLKVAHQRDQLLAALKAITDPNQVASHGDPSVLRNYARAAIATQLFGNSEKLPTIAATEEMQPVVTPLSEADLGDLIVSIADSKGFDVKDPDGVDELCRAVARAIEARNAAQQPASAQPVAVPEWLTFDRLVDSLAIFVSAAAKNPARDRLTADDWADTLNYMASQGGMFNAMAAIRTMLSAAKKPEGV